MAVTRGRSRTPRSATKERSQSKSRAKSVAADERPQKFGFRSILVRVQSLFMTSGGRAWWGETGEYTMANIGLLRRELEEEALVSL